MFGTPTHLMPTRQFAPAHEQEGVGDTFDVVPVGAFFGKGKRTGACINWLCGMRSLAWDRYERPCPAGKGCTLSP